MPRRQHVPSKGPAAQPGSTRRTYLVVMHTQNENAEARVRFDPVAPRWMVATVDGVRLASAPVRETEIDLTARELAGMLGTQLSIDVHDRAGHVERTVVGHPRSRSGPAALDVVVISAAFRCLVRGRGCVPGWV